MYVVRMVIMCALVFSLPFIAWSHKFIETFNVIHECTKY